MFSPPGRHARSGEGQRVKPGLAGPVPQSYDVLVVGTGAGAQSAAYPLRAAGLRVAVVDSRPMGGTCALRGCDPKKVLVDAARLADGVQRMRGEGVRCH